MLKDHLFKKKKKNLKAKLFAKKMRKGKSFFNNSQSIWVKPPSGHEKEDTWITGSEPSRLNLQLIEH